ncbi:MAG: extracellular solute-binding protein, partial [Propionibacteriaceae bacterium]|nr:extracellular solute-binding protein [Propionibacteriaceae bacterium]
MKKLSLATTGVVIALSLAACAANETGADSTTQTSASSATLTGVIDAGGSSAQTAAQEAWRAGFSATNPGVTVNYDPTGSGTGRQNFASGGYVLAGTDAAFSPDEATGSFAACAPGSTLVEIPAYISAIAIGFNLDGVSSLKL